MHQELSAPDILLGDEHGLNAVDKKPDVVQEWFETWAEYFRQDETMVDAEIQDLCERLRALAIAIES